MKRIDVIDLDPDERDDIERIIAKAKQLGGWLHIEIRTTEVNQGGTIEA